LRDKRKAMDEFGKARDTLREKMDATKPSTVKKFEEKQKEYYYAKAVYESVESMVGSVGQSSAAADAEVDKVRYTRKINDAEKEAMAATIKGFMEYNNNSKDPEDVKTGRMLLRKLEDDAEF